MEGKRRDGTVRCSAADLGPVPVHSQPTSAPYSVHNLDMLFNLSVLIWKMKMATGSIGHCEG